MDLFRLSDNTCEPRRLSLSGLCHCIVTVCLRLSITRVYLDKPAFLSLSLSLSQKASFLLIDLILIANIIHHSWCWLPLVSPSVTLPAQKKWIFYLLSPNYHFCYLGCIRIGSQRGAFNLSNIEATFKLSLMWLFLTLSFTWHVHLYHTNFVYLFFFLLNTLLHRSLCIW